jgi:hypothetical protein
MVCNGLLDPVRKAAILDRLEPITRDAFQEFWRCRGCGRIYWKGSHFEKLQALIEAVL